MELEINNLSLAYLCEELKPFLDNSTIIKIQEVSSSLLKAKIHSKAGTKTLILSPQALYLTSYSLQAKQQSSGFGAFLNKHLKGKKILSLSQHSFDRVLVLELQDCFLILEFFAEGNIVLADKSFLILGSLKREQWKDREIKKGAKYDFPKRAKLNPAELKETDLLESFEGKEKPITSALIESVNIAPIFAEEVCSLLKIKELKAKELKKEKAKELIEKIKQLYSVDLKKFSPLIIEKEGKQLLLPFSLQSLNAKARKVSSLNEAIDDFYSKGFLSEKSTGEAEVHSKKLLSFEHSLEQQLLASSRLQSSAEENKKKAEFLISQRAVLEELFRQIESFKEKGLNEKEIMYKVNLWLKESAAAQLAVIELKKNKLVLEFSN